MMSELKSKKRKFNVEGRVFQQKWESLYFFSIVQNKILCLICIKEITVPKEYNLRRHYEAFHRDKYDVFEGKLREEKLKKLKLDMQRQQNIFTVATKSNDAAIHASFAVSQIIAKNSKPHTDGEYVKKCMIKAVEILCPEKVKLFHAINLSANAVANHVNVFTEDEQLQVKEKCKDFVAYSIAIEENTSVPDHLQLAVYIRGISDDFELAVELLGMLPFNESTSADDIFSGLLSLLSKHVLPWEKMVGFLNDGARVMIDKSDSVAAKFKKIMKDFEGSSSFFTMHCILHQHELCASSLKMDHVIDTVIEIINYIRASAFTHQELLGLLDEVESEHNEIITRSNITGSVLKRFFDLLEAIRAFLHEENKTVDDLCNVSWISDLAFFVDVTEHMDSLNEELLSVNKPISEMFDCVSAFKMKLKLWDNQLKMNNLAYFPHLKSVESKCYLNMQKYTKSFTLLRHELEEQFQNFTIAEPEFKLFAFPLVADIQTAPDNIQMELISLQCDSKQNQYFAEMKLHDFYSQLPKDRYPHLRSFGLRMIAMFGSEQACEQFFFLVHNNKKRRSIEI